MATSRKLAGDRSRGRWSDATWTLRCARRERPPRRSPARRRSMCAHLVVRGARIAKAVNDVSFTVAAGRNPRHRRRRGKRADGTARGHRRNPRRHERHDHARPAGHHAAQRSRARRGGALAHPRRPAPARADTRLSDRREPDTRPAAPVHEQRRARARRDLRHAQHAIIEYDIRPRGSRACRPARSRAATSRRSSIARELSRAFTRAARGAADARRGRRRDRVHPRGAAQGARRGKGRAARVRRTEGSAHAFRSHRRHVWRPHRRDVLAERRERRGDRAVHDRRRASAHVA